MEEFSQFKYVYATDTPNKYIVINSNKDMLYNLGVDKGMVLIKLGKAYRSIFSQRSKKDIQEFNVSFSSEIDNLGEQLVKIVAFDGIVGTCCGLYIFFLHDVKESTDKSKIGIRIKEIFFIFPPIL